MVGDLAGKARPQVGHAQVVDQEFGQLVGALRPGLAARGSQTGSSGEQLQVAVADHRGAGAGRDDHRAGCASKTRMVCSAIRRACWAHPGVESRLPAAGLSGWKVDLHPGAFQDAHHCLAGFRVKRIDDAGDEELDGFRHAEVSISVH